MKRIGIWVSDLRLESQPLLWGGAAAQTLVAGAGDQEVDVPMATLTQFQQ